MIAKPVESTIDGEHGFQHAPLWTGPSRLATIRTAQLAPFESLLKPTFKDATAFRKKPHGGPVHLKLYGFGNDERAYPPHQNNSRAVLQYNPNHYPDWKRYFKDIKVQPDERRDALLDVGGFGENIYVENSPDTPPMDETSMCIGDLVSFQKEDGSECARIRLNGPRMPCYKLNHRFGIPNMSQRTQDKGWTGWLYQVEKEGDVEVGDLMVLLERPHPDWPVSRIQYYCFKEPRNFDMITKALEALGDQLLGEVKETFEDRLYKGMEDPSLRLQGDSEDTFTRFRLCDRSRETDRVSRFVFERVKKVWDGSKKFAVAKPGSHIRLRMKVDGRMIVRPYSVVSGDSNKFSLGIALADDSRGGSTFIHKTLKVGDMLEASENFANTFPLETEDADEHVFLAGGIGITAFLDHMKHCLETKQKFHLHYMIRNSSDYAFKQSIDDMLADTNATGHVTTYISVEGRRCNLTDVLKPLATKEKTHIYICGSEKMAEETKTTSQKLGIPDTRIHQEAFSIDASGDPFTAETTKSNKKIEVGSRQSLLDALREAGLEVASSCEAGNCGTCRVRVKCGRVLHKGTGLEDDDKAGYEENEEGDMLACVSRAVGTIALEL